METIVATFIGRAIDARAFAAVPTVKATSLLGVVGRLDIKKLNVSISPAVDHVFKQRSWEFHV